MLAAACTVTGTLYDDDPDTPNPSSPPDLPAMTLTLNKSGEVLIEIIGSRTITIDWNDGKQTETHTLSGNSSFTHEYANANQRTITIIGENITRLDCSNNQIIQLDVSEIATLTHLFCTGNQLTGLLDLSGNVLLRTVLCNDNQLTGLNVSANTALSALNCSNNRITGLVMTYNTALETLNCGFNEMNADALSALLLSLHGNSLSGGKTILINNNPGTDTCQNKDAAERSGWEVFDVVES